MKKILMFGVALVLLAGGIVSSSSAAEAEIVLVGHERIEDPLTQEEIQQIFLGKENQMERQYYHYLCHLQPGRSV